MNPLHGLTEYLDRIERRLRLLAASRGAAMVACAALLFTLLGAILSNYFGFSPGSVLSARVVLFLALAAAVGAGLVLPQMELNRRRAARQAEEKCPEFGQRLLTFAELAEQPAPFLELLASDTLSVARDAEPERVASKNRILSFASAGAVSAAVLLWLGISGTGFLGYGTQLLWGAIPHDQVPFYEIQVQPGNHTIRRKSDQLVTARLRGFQSGRVRVLAKFQSSSKWEEAPMHPQAGGPGFEFLFAGVPEPVDYYVEAAGVRSAQYRLNVIDLPEVKKLRVTYHYPAWSALKNTVEDPGGDLRAVEGTEAEVKVETDRPLSNGSLVLDDGSKFDLHDGVARIPMQKDGAYHVATTEHGEMVRLSNDYFIDVQKTTPPTLRIVRPGRDAKVSPIEEVTISVEAQDDFALKGVDLHYSVNGAKEKTVALGGASGKTAQDSTTLYLEDYKLVPGDVISVYATARDALAVSRSDMYFIEAQPFEREYSQSQQMGGAGGGENEPPASQRQKEIIAATWNQIKTPPKEKNTEEENARLLSGIQSKLRDQAKSLARRMASRELTGTNPAFQKFAEDMNQAVDAMGEAVDKLRARAWQGALPSEQRSLQHLERAEALFRQIQVAFGQGNGAGSARDLEGLFDLELDRQKNQFETGRNSASPDQRQKEIEEALAKLEELARRQQELAGQQRQNQQAYQQRWQQEMLRREAEELRRKMEQLARSQASQNQSSQSQQSQGQQGSQQSQDQQGQQTLQMSQAQQSAAVNRALERLTQALRDMQNAGSPQGQGSPQTEAEARRAAERLREAQQMLAGIERNQAGQEIDDLARKSQQLAEEQKQFENRMRQAFGQGEESQPSLLQPGTRRNQTGQLSADQEKLLKELTDLEEKAQKAARDMAGGQRSASSKLRDALGDLQKQELRYKMKWSLEVMRRGMGPYALMRQPPVTQGLDQLRDRIAEAQSEFHRGQGSGSDVESALARAEQLRRSLEQLRNNTDGRQRGENRNGQTSQPGERRSQQGQQGQQAQRDQQSGQGQSGQSQRMSGENSGTPGPGGAQGGTPDVNNGGGRFSSGVAPRGGYDPAVAERTLREGFRDLSQIEQFLRGNREIPRDTARDMLDTLRDLRNLDSTRLSTRPERIDQIIGQMLGGVEQIELELRRLADQKQSGSVRSGASQPAPPGYADAVAEYFKRLSKDK
ncbi:MAG TPA: hypothetical protein VJN43_23495 [Bryobacteraceae bacterium]|nr:hypothetical protein [Bryobacteraceae bacterium]